MTRYTLDEAAKIQAMNSCARNGHSWNIVQTWNGKGPIKIICDDCGWSGSVAMGEYPKRPEGAE